MIRLLLCWLALAPFAMAGSHLNVLVYHHVSEQTPASTSISPAKFREHLQFIKNNNYNVVVLEHALTALQNNEAIAENAIAITFDDGYGNIYDNALPLLEEFGYPFTIFVATDPIDQKFKNMLTWDQIRDLEQRGVTIANHSSDHDYLVREPNRDDRWLENTLDNINHAKDRLDAELHSPASKLFAYPYGEFTEKLKAALAEQGYIAVGQHSGGIWSESDFLSLPRFAAAGIYANTKTLKTKLDSQPMPVDQKNVADMITADTKPVLTTHLLNTDDLSINLNCFVDGQWAEANWQDGLSFIVRTDLPLNEGRHRFNCTSHSKSGGFYYWYSKPWLIYKADKK